MSVTAEPINVWEPRRALSLRQARRRSILIAGLRRFFVAAAGASFASVFVFMGLSALEGGLGASTRSNAEPLRMINPRFTGRTENGGPFRITAATAIREPGERQLVTLDSPVYRAEDGNTVVAPTGVYDEIGRTVTLEGDVLFSEAGGNRFSSPNMIIDLATGRVHGQAGVRGAGPLGVVQAEAYELRESDKAVVLRGRVRGQIPDRSQPQPAQDAQAPAPAGQ